MKYKNWIIGALLLATGALTSNATLVAQGVGSVIQASQGEASNDS